MEGFKRKNRIILEKNTSDEMKWQLDHIIPISHAKDIDEIVKFNHYSNFQPMWETENKSKGNKIAKKSSVN